MLKREDALRLFNYNPDTGILTWRIHVGCFDDIEEARKAMENARIKYHGEFSSMG
ncbi:hypothetical protein PS047_08230 [Escherichia albertii]|uniref:hypothetical protein n=1 Tax=Escherichia albertii TaxID=208962 RepID=UPI001CB9C91F|nr:hypothetical protein [Escherichia albertii]MCZ8912033.1 hypothetical protein [Escherichia albertii]MCZ8945082.1 hypothetical protein [Escherichia albertii]MCZ8950291.1 hypothetical protein [Escherichia albertii]MCZ8974279.1 hypothetical protein [Escherichia albertii]MCZ8984358.1 hypothetical protein [Escherichia albertii]